MPGPLRLQLAVAEAGDPAKPATFKVDGKRFLNTDSTLKLGSGRLYELLLTFNQPVVISASNLKLYDQQESLEPLQLSDVSKEPDVRTLLSGSWKCSLPISKDETRTYAWLQLDVQGYGTCACPLVLKTYHPDNSSRHHGFALRYVQFEFAPDPAHPDVASLQGTIFFRY